MAVNINKDAAYRAAKPKEKDYTINDDGGLFFFVGANGAKLWRFVYTIAGKRKKLGFGTYPDTTLENARRQAKEARQQIAEGIAPAKSDGRKKQLSDLPDKTKTAKKKACRSWTVPPMLPGNGWLQSLT